MSQLLLIFIVLFAGPAYQDADGSAVVNNIEELVQELTELGRSKPSTDRESLIELQKKRVDLADQILAHPETDESQRVLAAITKLQAFGIHFAINYRQKIQNDQLIKDYRETINQLLDDADERIVLEATTANASLVSGLFVNTPDESLALETSNALLKLEQIAPEDPLIQTTRRVLLERIWNSEKPEMVFRNLVESEDKPARIVMDQIEEKTDRETADFLWARHYAKIGDFVAMRRLAEKYEDGKGSKVNYVQAARWYTKLSRLGDLKAQIKMGDFYIEGKGFSADPEVAVEFYQDAARSGSRVAQFKLGECYRSGQGVEPDDGNWRMWIKSAAFNATGSEVREIYNAIHFKTAPDSYQIFYEVLLDQNPDDIYYLNNLAYSLLIGTRKDPERSLKLIDQAIENAPEDFDGLANFQDTRATALKQTNKWEEAAKLFELILDQSDDKQSVLESLIECFDQFDKDKADKYREQLKTMSDDS